MPVTADDISALAGRLAVQEADEVDLRAAISRSYYAAYHEVFPFVDRLPVSENCPRSVGDKVTHTEMTERLREWRVSGVQSSLAKMKVTGGQLLETIEAMRFARVKADYRLNTDVALTEAQMQIARAKQVKRAMFQIFAEINRTQASGTGP